LVSVILGEEHRLRVAENRVLRIIFGSKKEEVTWDWRSFIAYCHKILFE
jgi:hypothetical protein